MSSESLPDPRHDLAAYEQAVYWRYVRQHQQERDDAALARALQAELDAEGQIGVFKTAPNQLAPGSKCK